MTTTVRIDAHLANDKEVSVSILGDSGEIEHFVLQDGESEERHVYDDRIIMVKEVMKKT